jgi:hypothetical protein
MTKTLCRTVCWMPTWNKERQRVGLEHLLLTDQAADGVILGFDEEHGAFRLTYQLQWTPSWQIRDARLFLATARGTQSLHLQTDGEGRWRRGDGHSLDALAGCRDIDIWPTPFTNTFPIRRTPLQVGERREFLMAWVFGLDLTVHAQPQAYTRIAERVYLFENLDGSDFKAELPVDEDGIVIDYPELFLRVPA